MAFGNSANNVTSPAALRKVTEVFDSANTGNLRDYLRGSLPYPVTNAYSSIAASGTLTLTSFEGANNPPTIIYSSGIFLADDAFYYDYAATQITFSTNGFLYEYEGGVTTGTNRWLYAGNQVDYDVRFTQTTKFGSAAMSGPTVNTWHNLASSRSWYINAYADHFDIHQWGGYLELRMNASPQTVISNSSFVMTCTTEL